MLCIHPVQFFTELLCFGNVLRVGIKFGKQSGRKLRLFTDIHAVRRRLNQLFKAVNFRDSGLFSVRTVRIAVFRCRIGNNRHFLIVVLLVSLPDHILHLRCTLPLRSILNDRFKKRNGPFWCAVAAKEPAHSLTIHLFLGDNKLLIKDGIIIRDTSVILLNQFLIGGKRLFVFSPCKIEFSNLLFGSRCLGIFRPALYKNLILLPRTFSMPAIPQ